jgi:hypothetical protein
MPDWADEDITLSIVTFDRSEESLHYQSGGLRWTQKMRQLAKV